MKDLPPLTPREILCFFKNVQISKTESWGPDGGVETLCWNWTGTQTSNGDGYGKFKFAGKTWRAHRWTFLRWKEWYYERDEDVHHCCCNSSCVNPAHLANKHKSHRWKETNGVPF